MPDIADVEPPREGGLEPGRALAPGVCRQPAQFTDKTESYEIFRHPEGGRKDVFRWSGRRGIWPVAELEIYRPGGELEPCGPAMADIAARMDPRRGRRELEAAGVIDSKFGHVTLLRLTGGADGARACLGFIKRVDEPNLQISGWSCQGENLAGPARRDLLHAEPAGPADGRK